MPSRLARTRALVPGIALALTVPLLGALPALAATSAEPPAPEATVAPFTLWAPKAVIAYSYRDRAYTDLGLRVIAQGAPFEVWAHRPSYAQGIQAVWRSSAGDVTLPAGSMTDFAGIGRFVTLTITPAAGGKPVTVARKACLNSWSERVRPDAPATSDYPMGCWYNPYSRGSVQGVQEGWASPILSTERPLPLTSGRYTVKATISPKYAKAFGLTPAAATRTIKLRVTKDEGEEGRVGTPGHRATHPVAKPAAQAPTGPAGRQVTGPIPDLRSLPAWGISLSKNKRYLRFSATVWNAGNSPLVVDGFRRDGEDEMDAYQYFFDGDGNQTGYQPVGHLHWDAQPSHQHWHFDDFARYSLLNKDKVEAKRSKKEAFCLANTDAVDLTVPDAEWRPENTDLSTSCGDYTSLSIREVLAAGWGDTYTQYRAGQSFDISKLPNGIYYVAVIANPDNELVEASTTNNVALRRIKISGRADTRKVTVPQVGIIKEEGYGGTG